VVPAQARRAEENNVDNFEDLGVAPELAEALAAEGIETPTPIQRDAIPIIRKGNNLVLEAGPGSGLLVGWATGLIERIEAAGEGPRVLVLSSTDEAADQLAEAMARLTVGTDHRVAALGGAWVLPEKADIVFGTPTSVLRVVAENNLSLALVETVVVDQAQLIESVGRLPGVEQVFDYLPEGTQRVLSALPITPAVADLVNRAFKRTVTIPSTMNEVTASRGTVRFRIAPEPREAAALNVIESLLSDGARHALVYCRTEDRAADIGDYLTLHGFTAGAPGDESVPVWLGVDALEARAEAKDVEGVVVVSCDCPADDDTLDRRHSMGADNVVVLLPREVAHLKRLGRRTGYETVPFPPKSVANDSVAQLRESIDRAMETEDITPYLVALEPLLARYDAAEIAAAALALLRKKTAPAAPASPAQPQRAAAQATGTPSWAKLFITVGERDGLEKGDLLGAITGEAGIDGAAVGRIDIKESHSIVEVHDAVARNVIQALNGTSIKGRSARVDFDRPRKTPARRPNPRS
jgi:ATP-dependent RNA helicase DeaD